jgi:acyl-Coa thioesterase superfamily protein/acyl-CoA thioesterase superfamily protein
MGEEAFYLPLGGDVYRATEHTVGPWSPDSQHMGPPSALLARQLERTVPAPDAVLARMTVEILGPVPIADLAVRSWVERPGRSVRLIGAELSAGGRAVVRAWAWWLNGTDTAGVLAGLPDPLPPLASGTIPARPDGWRGGYLDAMEWVSISGSFGVDGPATLWIRQRMPTVDGEQPSGLQRLMAVADSGNGASSRLDVRSWLFINTELTVHLWRVPGGEWIGLDATSVLGPTGVGLATSTLHDADGPVGRGAQALLVRPR